MNRMRRSLAVAGLHVLLVAGLGAKLLIDRATLPRAWVLAETAGPAQGRYIRLHLRALYAGPAPEAGLSHERVILRVEGERAVAAPVSSGGVFARIEWADARWQAALLPAIVFFLPGPVDLPLRERGEELWVEAVIPENGLARPIRLGRLIDGRFRPLAPQ
ncbi:MAG: hypothetical protein ACK5AZ_05660 [Bryobacteraceae bacterium]